MFLIISAVFPPEPVVSANLSFDLANTLSQDFKVHVLTPAASRPKGFIFDDFKKKESFEKTILKSFVYPESKIMGRMRESFSFGWHASNYIRRNHDIIRVIYANTWPLLSQYMIIATAKRFSIPVILHVQDIYPESMISKLRFFRGLFYRLLLPLDKVTMKNAAQVVTLSSKMRDHLITTRKIEDSKVQVIYNWQNDSLFEHYNKLPRREQRKPTFTFMFVGSLSRTAAIHIIISAFKMSRLVNARLVIAGNGTEKEYLLSLAGDGHGTGIEFWDAPVSKIPEIQDQADVMLVSLERDASRFAMPSKLIAYMFSEKPVIACVEETSDTALAVLNARCGWVTEPENDTTLSKIMKYVYQLSEQVLHNYGKNGRKYALNNFTREKNLHKLANLIKDLGNP